MNIAGMVRAFARKLTRGFSDCNVRRVSLAADRIGEPCQGRTDRPRDFWLCDNAGFVQVFPKKGYCNTRLRYDSRRHHVKRFRRLPEIARICISDTVSSMSKLSLGLRDVPSKRANLRSPPANSVIASGFITSEKQSQSGIDYHTGEWKLPRI